MTKEATLLGKVTDYPKSYTPALLHPVARLDGRKAIGLGADPIFHGFDLWTAYELSWLDTSGKPNVAIADISLPCNTENLIESKSLKLYLNSINQSVFSSPQEVSAIIEQDLTLCANGPVAVAIHTLESYRHRGLSFFPGQCLDDLDVKIDSYEPNPSLLSVNPEGGEISEAYFSHLLKTNCPVTGQPDWASIFVRYTGRPIDPHGLLKYLVSFRNHQDYHEQCVERIYTEINKLCQPSVLEVYARYTRRGGLDINPFRSSEKIAPLNLRLSRQ